MHMLNIRCPKHELNICEHLSCVIQKVQMNSGKLYTSVAIVKTTSVAIVKTVVVVEAQVLCILVSKF